MNTCIKKLQRAALLPTVLFRGFIGAFLLFVAFVMLTSWKPSAHRTRPGPALAGLLGQAGIYLFQLSFA